MWIGFLQFGNTTVTSYIHLKYEKYQRAVNKINCGNRKRTFLYVSMHKTLIACKPVGTDINTNELIFKFTFWWDNCNKKGLIKTGW